MLLDADAAAALEVPRGRIRSAVLVPLYVQRDELHAVFTKRRDDLRHHAGQISFPGGRHEAADGSLQLTALREADEEIGLHPDAVTLLGALQPVPTIATDFEIYPFVGMIRPEHSWTPSEREVEAVLDLPLREVRAGYARQAITRRGISFRTDTYAVAGQVIWGATARLVADLLERLDAVAGVGG